jgi:NTE family protein
MKNLIIIVLFLISYSSQAQIQNLVFEGAGIRGIAYAGVVQELEDQNRLLQIKKVGGTSAGAITALLIALNYNATEIETIVGSTNFKKFNDGRFLFAGGINRLNKYFGWYRGNRFENWLEKIIKAKTGNADITFIELKNKGFKELYITGTNLNLQKLVVFSYENFPNMKVKDAVRISISIPLYFEPLYLDASGNVVKRPKDKAGVHVMLDGGFIANYPIQLFDTIGNVRKINPHTLGFRIDSDDQINYDSTQKGLAPMPINNLQQYIGAFYNIIIENLNRQTLTKQDWQRTVSISDGNIGPRIRKLKKEEIRTLVENGRKATGIYLADLGQQ